MTDIEVKIKVEDLIRVCYVFPYATINDLDFWTALSADHFYLKFRFPSLDVSSWNDRQPINQDMYVCVECCGEKLGQIRLMKQFLSLGNQQPLRALDLFGGVGAFGLGMEESGCIKITHAIEISPSASKTFEYALSCSAYGLVI
jgi:DNA (cytosine-5)-methyltransferase 1